MTVIARRVAATPARTAAETWLTIVDLIAPSDGTARRELTAIGGVAACLIADEAMRQTPIVVWGVGPLLRVYCLYDEDAITGDEASEGTLGWCPTEGDWSMSLPCPDADLSWVQEALKRVTLRVTARGPSDTVPPDSSDDRGSLTEAEIDVQAFLRP
jgi:hypothetical protein